MPHPQPLPAWASTSLVDLFAGPVRAGRVLAANAVASYVAASDASTSRTLLALLTPNAVRVPIGVCVTEGALPEQGEAVDVGAGLVATSDRTWRPVRWWNPRPRIRRDELLAHGDVLRDIVRGEPAASFGMPLSDAFTVATALTNGHPDAALAVLGSGPGLTPTGDDVVAGALAVLAITGRLDDSVREVVEAYARNRTTTLSAALVAAAGRGEMIPQAARVLVYVAAGEPRARAASAAASLFTVGATSGHDLAAGMAGALEALR